MRERGNQIRWLEIERPSGRSRNAVVSASSTEHFQAPARQLTSQADGICYLVHELKGILLMSPPDQTILIRIQSVPGDRRRGRLR